jgi:uncharacterized protein YecA (UPF0149 family)
VLTTYPHKNFDDVKGIAEPAVHRLFQYFFQQRKQAKAPYIRESHKVGRNNPCPCGSGKKFKRSCLH